MTYHDVARRFAKANRDEDDYSYLYLSHRDQMTWDKLLQHKLVVVLASASSGKTYEFEGQATTLEKEGLISAFIAIEELAGSNVEELLSRETRQKIDVWRQTSDAGYFFLDSVDEAKLKSKADYRRALRKIEIFLGDKLTDSHIYISCRPSDWSDDEDPDFVKKLFELTGQDDRDRDDADDEVEPLEGEALKNSILKRVTERHQNQNDSFNADEDASENYKLHIVALQPLSGAQQRELVREHCSVNDLDTFFKSIVNNGLEPFAKRPGDLLNLARYWEDNGRFDTLAKMTDAGISRMLKEEKSSRTDGSQLSLKKAREGAERLAVALTLGNTLTLCKPGQTLPSVQKDASLNVSEVLKDWTDFEIETLLRRGLFAPASFGAVRFQHRSSIQFLTAKYLLKCMAKPGGRKSVTDILFKDAFGVETVVAELRPSAAWMALKDDLIRNKIADREPYELIRYGDAKSLDLTTRALLLTRYAKAQGDGDVANDSIDHRAIWSFADKGLSQTIRECWEIKEEHSLRFFLIRLIEEGEIHDCADLVKSIAESSDVQGAKRSLAVRCLIRLGEDDFVRSVASKVAKGKLGENETESTFTSLLEYLYPDYLNVSGYGECLKRHPKGLRDMYSNIASSIPRFVEDCPVKNLNDHLELLTDLATTPPHKSHFRPLSETFGYIAGHFHAVVSQTFERTSAPDIRSLLARMTVIGSFAQFEYSSTSEARNNVRNYIEENSDFKRLCFLAGVDLAKTAPPKDGFESQPWRMRLTGINGGIYELTEKDFNWLVALIEGEANDEHLRLAAFHALLQTCSRLNILQDRKVLLRKLSAFNAHASKWLDGFLAPPKKDPYHEKWKKRRLKQEKQKRRKDLRNTANWITYGQELKNNLPEITLKNDLYWPRLGNGFKPYEVPQNNMRWKRAENWTRLA